MVYDADLQPSRVEPQVVVSTEAIGEVREIEFALVVADAACASTVSTSQRKLFVIRMIRYTCGNVVRHSERATQKESTNSIVYTCRQSRLLDAPRYGVLATMGSTMFMYMSPTEPYMTTIIDAQQRANAKRTERGGRERDEYGPRSRGQGGNKGRKSWGGEQRVVLDDYVVGMKLKARNNPLERSTTKWKRKRATLTS